MIIGFNGENHEVDEDDVAIIYYPNDMMDGLFIDLGDNYGFISAHQPGYEEFSEQAIEMGVNEYELCDSDLDLTQPPHAWVMQSLIRLVITSAEELL